MIMDLLTGRTSPISVFVLDDHEVIVRGLIEMIEAEDDMVVVGSASSEAEAVSGILATRPDVAVLDVRLEVGCGFNVCREVTRRIPGLAAILFTSAEDERVLIEAAACGAVGVCHKTDRTQHIVAAVRDAADGIDLLDSRQLDAAVVSSHSSSYPLLDDLTENERRIVTMIGRGMSNREIGAEVFLAEKTVKNYVSNLLTKLGLSRRAEVAAIAARLDEREVAWRSLFGEPAGLG